MVTLRELDLHLVAGDEPDEVGAETVGHMSEDPGPVLQLDPVHPVGERFENPTFDELQRPGHERRLYLKPGMPKLRAFANRSIIPQPSCSQTRSRW